MKKLLLILLCLPMIGFGQCISGDCENGWGTRVSDVSKTKYTGSWKNGEKHGKGTYTRGENKYVGTFKYNMYDGNGTMTFASGSKYIGEWKDDEMHGQGTYFWYYGDKYVGEWKGGTKNGKGIYFWDDGTEYDGEWKGKMNGIGKMTHKNGRIEEGLWKDGKFLGE